jgi:hypothetical protein
MSKIEAFFSASGRGLFDSEKPAVEEFKAKYARPFSRSAGAEPGPGADRTKRPPMVIVKVRGAVARQLTEEKDVKTPKNLGVQARALKRQKFSNLVVKKLGAAKIR